MPDNNNYMDDSNTVVLMDDRRIERSLKRIAHQIAEDNRSEKELVVLGINERGYAVACALNKYLSALIGKEVGCYRILPAGDDKIEGVTSLQNKYVLLVDDVIFSGTTMFKALSIISKTEYPDEVHTAALIDRGHRKFPIIARFTGMELPTKLNEHVTVEVKDNKIKQVFLSQSVH